MSNYKFPPEYVVDVTKPPIGPPIRIIREGMFGEKETEESIEATLRWKIYSGEYRATMDKMRNIESITPNGILRN